MSSSRHVVASAAVLFLSAGSAFAQLGGTPVAVTGLTGQYGPGIGANTFATTSFSTAGRNSVIDGQGDVMMIGSFPGGTGVWRNLAGSNANVNLARGNMALPAPASSGTYSTTLAWSSLYLDSTGNGLFYGPILGTTGINGWTSDSGMVRASNTGAVNFASRGTNTSGDQFNAVGGGSPLPTDRTGSPVMQLNASTNGGMQLNNNGQSLLSASWRTAGGAQSGNGVWLGSSNAGTYDTLTPVMLRGDTVDGFGFTGVQADFIANMSFNDNGRYAADMDFISGTGSPARTSAQNRGLATNRNGTTELLMMRNTAAPWLDSGVVVGAIGSISPSMNNAGQIAQAFPISGTGITAANDTVVGYFRNDGSVALLHEGAATDRTTALGNTVLLGNLTNTAAVMSARGTVFSFTSGNTDSAGNVLGAGAGNASLYSWSPTSGVHTIALTGDTAPGTSGGQFASFNSAGRAVNGNDQIAFLTNLVTTAGNPGGVTTANDLCLYATDPSGNLILIAREGSALPGDPVGGRTVSNILFGGGAINLATNGQDGRGVFFNDAGQLVFQVAFNDGNSGVFVANVTPAPSAAGLFGLGMAAAGLRRRRA